MTDKTLEHPLLKANVMALFPTLDSLQDVLELAESKLPITDSNDLYVLFMTYHNTLIKELT